MFVFSQQPNIGELRQTAQLVDLVVYFYDFLLIFFPLLVDLYLFVENLLTLCLKFLHPFSAMLFLLLLQLFRRDLLSFEYYFFIFLELPQPILHILLLLQQLILHFIVIPEEVHLVIDE